MILADENISSEIINALRSSGVEVFSIKENQSGVSDDEVINLSKKPPRVILTEDKDFGEWVYAHGEGKISVILLRYRSVDIKPSYIFISLVYTLPVRWKLTNPLEPSSALLLRVPFLSVFVT